MKTLVTLVILIVAGIIFPFVGIHYETGSGSQVGYISAVEKEGLFFKTGRVYIKPTLESTQEDIYCVVDDALLEELGEKARLHERVEVSHVSWLNAGVKNCASESAVVTSLKVL